MMSPTLKAQRVAGVFVTDSSAFMDTPSANMEDPNLTVADQENWTCGCKIFCEVFSEGTWQREVRRGRKVSSFWNVGNEAMVLSEIFLGQ